MTVIDAALEVMAAYIDAGSRGVAGDETFHAAAAAHSKVLARMMRPLSDQITETRPESLGRPAASLAQHRRIADAIRAGDAEAASAALHTRLAAVSDLAILARINRSGGDGDGRETPRGAARADRP